MQALSARTLHHMPYALAAPRLAAMGIAGGEALLNEAFWTAVRGNLERFADVALWASVVAGPVRPPPPGRWGGRRPCRASARAWDATTWKALTDAVKATTGAKGRELFMPLRLALTGLDHGRALGLAAADRAGEGTQAAFGRGRTERLATYPARNASPGNY